MKKLIVINIILMFLLSVLPVSEQKTEQLNTVVNSNEQLISSRSTEIRTEPIVEETTIENKPTNISEEGLDYIKRKEGFIDVAKRLQGEEFFTIRISGIMEVM